MFLIKIVDNDKFGQNTRNDASTGSCSLTILEYVLLKQTILRLFFQSNVFYCQKNNFHYFLFIFSIFTLTQSTFSVCLYNNNFYTKVFPPSFNLH